jgi:hypothetical protein
VRLSEFLNALDFGHETAERDEALGRMFVRTHDFVELVKGKPDLITGVKGSGKSALYLTLLQGSATPADLHLVAAQNARGPLIFASTLPEDRASLTSEEYFQKRWTAHSIGLAANKLIDAHPGDGRLAALRDAALAADLLIETPDETKMWERSGRGRFFGSAFTGAAEGEPSVHPDQLMRRVMKELADGLELLDEHIWVLYDRLDDILVYDPPRERAMLRGLLQAMVSLASLSNRLKMKTFLRHDILDRVTAEHPVRNIDHLSRLRIKWNSRAIMRLAAVRSASTPGAPEALRLSPGESPDRLTDAQVDEVWLRFIRVPSGFVGKGKPERSFHHLFAQTFDATKEYNPRIVLGYLTILAREQAALCQNDDPELPIDVAAGVLSLHGIPAPQAAHPAPERSTEQLRRRPGPESGPGPGGVVDHGGGDLRTPVLRTPGLRTGEGPLLGREAVQGEPPEQGRDSTTPAARRRSPRGARSPARRIPARRRSGDVGRPAPRSTPWQTDDPHIPGQVDHGDSCGSRPYLPALRREGRVVRADRGRARHPSGIGGVGRARA